MAFNNTTQVNRNAVTKAVRQLEVAIRPSINGANLRGVRNDVTDTQMNARCQAVADALKAAGYTAV